MLSGNYFVTEHTYTELFFLLSFPLVYEVEKLLYSSKNMKNVNFLEEGQIILGVFYFKIFVPK